MTNRCCCNKPTVFPWIILAIGVLNVNFLAGKRRSFGIFIADFKKQYSNITLTELNWIGDSYTALAAVTIGLSISIIVLFKRRYGLFQFIGVLWILVSCLTSAFVPNPHWLFLTHTLFHGIGSSLITSVSILVVNEYFDEDHPHHILATTLVSGGTATTIIFVSLFSSLIQKYGWRNSFIIAGAIYFFVIGIAAVFLRKNKNFDESKHKKSKCCESLKISNAHRFLLALWFMDRVLTTVVTHGLLMNLTDYLHRWHANLIQSSILTLLFVSGEDLTYLMATIITAITKDLFKEKLRYILLGASILMSICLVLLEFLNRYTALCYILCFLSGFFLGPSVTFIFPVGEELTRLPGHVAYPISVGGMGLGLIGAPLFSAKVAETFKYKWFFLIQGVLMCIKVIFLIAIVIMLHFYQTRFDSEDFSKENEKEPPDSTIENDESWPILNENEKK